jgi:hypothetical protein
MELRIKCQELRFENIYSCSTHSNNSDWLKAIKKKRQDETQISTKFDANLSFSPHSSPVYFFPLFFRNLTPFMTKQQVLVL